LALSRHIKEKYKARRFEDFLEKENKGKGEESNDGAPWKGRQSY